MENEEIEGGPEGLTPETFSFFDVLSEKAYPRDIVNVYLDDAAAYDLRKIGDEAEEMDPDNAEAINALGERLKALRQRIEASAMTFHLAGVGADRMQEAMQVANDHFEGKKVNRKRADGSIMRELPQEQQVAFMRYASAVTLSLHIERIVLADGRAQTAPSPDEIAAFLDKAPLAAVNTINDAVKALQVSTQDFERTLDEGFLAKP